MFECPEKYCVDTRGSHLPPTKEGDQFGVFQIPIRKPLLIFCIASSGSEQVPWEHVSVSIRNTKGKQINRCPTWEEMCKVKDLFWSDNDTVVQFHPPKSEYVNNHPFCLHLWRDHEGNIKTPPKIAVGL